jgi:hypothetical protein
MQKINEDGCPYPSRVLNGEECNRDRIIFFEGYEAYKFEMLKVAESMNALTDELDKEVREVREIREELKQRLGRK